MSTIGNVFYGAYWRIEGDARDEATTKLIAALEAEGELEFSDLLDDLSEKYNAHLSFHEDGTVTVYFGFSLTSLSEADNDFDEMALIRIIDLDKGVLRYDVKEKVKGILQEVPYGLRESLSAPGFYVAWETT